MAEYINIHTHKPVGGNIELINVPVVGEWSQGKFYSFGLHPWEIGKVNENIILNELQNCCERDKIIAVGEIGLDRAIATPLEIQIKYFLQQLAIAEKYTLPIIIHNVRATSDLFQQKKASSSSIPWIFHGFKGSFQDALQLIDKQCFLSFGTSILNHTKSQEVLKKIPLDYVFFETDESDENILNIYEKAAELLDICSSDLKEKVYSNFIKVFGEICTMNG